MTSVEIIILAIHSMQMSFTVIGICVVLWQVGKDHRRRRRDATINIIVQARAQRASIERSLSESKLSLPLDEDSLARAKRDPRVLIEIRHMLGLYEYISTATLMGVFDYEFLNRMAGSRIVTTWNEFHVYIVESVNNSQTGHRVYDQFQDLVIRLCSDDPRLRYKPVYRGAPARLANRKSAT